MLHYRIHKRMFCVYLIVLITFLVIMSLVLYYMKNRVGLKPEEYRKKDINYKEYVRLK